MKRDNITTRGYDKLEGRYANYFEIGHSESEFVIDFGQFYSEGGQVKLHTRIVTNPRYARELLRVLQKSLKTHEQGFGSIQKDVER